jgi:glycosyltransferase involved in cell wall biosynthesis
VVSDRPPLSELIHDGAAVAVPPGNPEALAACLRALLSDPQRRAAMAQQARQAACEHYQIDRVSRQHESLYEELIERYGV